MTSRKGKVLYLDSESQHDWQSQVETLFARVDSSGSTRLKDNLSLVLKAGDQEQVVHCKQGLEVWFPNHQNPQSNGSKAPIRKRGHAIIFSPEFQLTLKATGDKIDAKYTSLVDRTRPFIL